MKKHIVVLSGAGISAESGVSTFRDSGGLWEGYDVEEVATIHGWNVNQQKVLDFYNQRRRQLSEVEPNDAHKLLVELEKEYDVTIVTQNVDDLHERAGSSNIVHLHGELLKARSTKNDSYVIPWTIDMSENDIDDEGNQLRPHIVWFGEDVPLLREASKIVKGADIVIIIGTSMQVYPAAGLVEYARTRNIFYIDPNPAFIHDNDVKVIKNIASLGLKEFIENHLKNC